MANVLVNDASLADIAEAIREKNGTEETYKPAEMGDAVRAIQSGGNGDFVGIKYSDFIESGYWLPRVADARSLEYSINNNSAAGDVIALNLFSNFTANGNGGFHVKMEDVYLPSGLLALSGTFQNCSSLKNIYGDLSMIASLGNSFTKCVSLTEIPYMPNITYFGANCFQGCTGLTRAKIYSKPTTMMATTFNGCTNIKDIYVPWSEGEVANAPWGATNATIHYNTVYDENNEPIV